MWLLRALALVALAAYWFLLGGITQLGPFYVWSAVFLALAAIGVMVILTAGRGLQMTRDMPQVATEDDPVEITLRLRNASWLPKSLLRIMDHFPAGGPGETSQYALIGRAPPGQTVAWSYRATCYKRGEYFIGPAEATTHDPVGLFAARLRFTGRRRLLVYPRTFPIRQFPFILSGRTPRFGLEVGRLGGGDVGDFYGIREYRTGDSLQRVHWRSSARLGKLVVKQFEKSTVGEVTLVLDLMRGHDVGAGKETTLEYAVKIIASCAEYLIGQQALVQLICYGQANRSVPFGRGPTHLLRLLETLALVEADGPSSLGQVLRTVEPIVPQGSMCLVCMLNNDLEALGALLQLRLKGVTPVVFALDAATFSTGPRWERGRAFAPQEIRQVLTSPEARAYRIRQGENLGLQFTQHVR